MRNLIQKVGWVALGAQTFLIGKLALAAPSFPVIDPVSAGDETKIIDVIEKVVNFLLILAGALAVAYLIWAGIQYITGGAKGEENAKKAIINAVIGVIIIVLSYVIVNAAINLVQ